MSYVTQITCKRPHGWFAGRGEYGYPGDWETTDPRFRVNGGRRNHANGWLIVRNGIEPCRFMTRYDLYDKRFPTRKAAILALWFFLQREADLPADERVIDPAAPDRDEYEQRSNREIETLTDEMVAYHERGEKHPFEKYLSARHLFGDES